MKGRRHGLREGQCGACLKPIAGTRHVPLGPPTFACRVEPQEGLWPRDWDHPARVAWRLVWWLPTVLASLVLVVFVGIKEGPTPRSFVDAWDEVMRSG